MLPGNAIFGAAHLENLLESARRYLAHTIALGTPLASAVRLRMHGEIRLKRWFPFTAEQVIALDRGMIWNATVRMYGVPVQGFDRLIDHVGAMQWKILGIIPLINAAGADITRSAAGRVIAESMWLPPVFLRTDKVWKEVGLAHASVCVPIEGERPELTLAVAATGRVENVAVERWGNPDGTGYRYIPFGGIASREGTFGGYTMSTQLRVGWYFGTERFKTDGEFFRCTIDHAEFR